MSHLLGLPETNPLVGTVSMASIAKHFAVHYSTVNSGGESMGGWG